MGRSNSMHDSARNTCDSVDAKRKERIPVLNTKFETNAAVTCVTLLLRIPEVESSNLDPQNGSLPTSILIFLGCNGPNRDTT